MSNNTHVPPASRQDRRRETSPGYYIVRVLRWLILPLVVLSALCWLVSLALPLADGSSTTLLNLRQLLTAARWFFTIAAVLLLFFFKAAPACFPAFFSRIASRWAAPRDSPR